MPRPSVRLPSVYAAGKLTILLFVLCCSFRQGAASAQSTSARTSEPSGYRALVTDAVAEYSAGNFAEARSLFDKANTVYSTARALRGLGMAEFELRNYSDSASFLQRALESNVLPLEGGLRADTERLLGRANGFIAQFDVAIEPGGSTVIVDGTPVQLGTQGRLILQVGDHVLEFSAQGYQPEKRVLRVKGGEQQALRIVLPQDRSSQPQLQLQVQPEAVSTGAPAAATRADSGEPARKPLYKNPWLWTGVGVVAVGLAVGLGVGLSRGNPGKSDPLGGPYPNALVAP